MDYGRHTGQRIENKDNFTTLNGKAGLVNPSSERKNPRIIGNIAINSQETLSSSEMEGKGDRQNTYGTIIDLGDSIKPLDVSDSSYETYVVDEADKSEEHTVNFYKGIKRADIERVENLFNKRTIETPNGLAEAYDRFTKTKIESLNSTFGSGSAAEGIVTGKAA